MVPTKILHLLKKNRRVEKSMALSMTGSIRNTVKGRCIAALVTHGVNASALNDLKSKVASQGGKVRAIAPTLGEVTAADGTNIAIDEILFNTVSVLYDAVYIPGGKQSVEALVSVFDRSGIAPDEFVCNNSDNFLSAAGRHRLWEREEQRKIPS